MINGVHTLIYTEKAADLRTFFKDVLEFPYIDSGEGWLIFKLPPGEIGVHPADFEGAEENRHEIFLMCDDIDKTVGELKAKGP